MRSNVLGSAAEFRRRPARRVRPPVDSHLAQVFMRDLRTPAPPQLPIFRSRRQGELLARLLLGPEREMTMLDLAVMLRTDLGTVAGEVERLARAGILRLRRTPAGRLVARDTSSPMFAPLARLVMLGFGPSAVVTEHFAPLPGIAELHLFGAWAGHYADDGYPSRGSEPSGEVEVLVVGDVSREAAFVAAQECAARLGLPVHAVVRSRARWREDDDPFLREIRSGHVLRIPLP
ncbi:ArsR family transcriptional regulator [Actinomadura harenae]|uniref:ArsR family transcriptional regulator n=1 Tax=Actinomadura harenae TaxID=2483351 RepID=UPI0011C412FC|nr:ArsR family transcriptional regulator [Actinomadura harenae]